MKPCNPKSNKANDPKYICNPLTGRWILKKASKKAKPIKKTSEKQIIYKPVSNRACISDKFTLKNFNVCMNSGLSNIVITKEIGSGSFGVVYKGTVMFDPNFGKPIPLVNRRKKSDLKQIDIAVKQQKYSSIITNEIDFSIYMGEADIGPKVYDYFFVKEGIRTNQYIIMEYFDINAYNALLTTTDAKHIISEMCRILHTQIYDYGMNCFDIKPENYVYRFADKTVRQIDFGVDFCKFDIIPDNDKAVVYKILVAQLAHLSPPEYTSHFDLFKLEDTDEMIKILKKYPVLNKIFKWYVLSHYNGTLKEKMIKLYNDVTTTY